MGGVVGLAKLLLKPAARKIAQETGVGAVKIPTLPLEMKLADLATKDNGVCADYIKSLITQAKSPEQIKIIQEYLASSRNNIPSNTTLKLVTSTMRKLHDIEVNEAYQHMAKEFLDKATVKATMVLGMFVDHL